MAIKGRMEEMTCGRPREMLLYHVRLLKKFDRLQTNIDVYKGKYS